jgi:LysR family glycine cleavage system transcriptional activator
VPLFEYALFPVCSPAFIAALGGAIDVAGLMAQPLVAIYTEVQNWEGWFESAGVAFAPQVPCIMVDTCAVAIEMALAGRGVALINGPFVDAELAEGRLVMPVPHRELCPGAWGLICRKDLKDNRRIATFIDWISTHAAMPS